MTVWHLGGGRQIDFRGRAQIMGVLNATPDSFYDGGRYHDPTAAVERALRMIAEGADILDIGGESSRPPLYGEAVEVSAQQECDRVLPVIERIRQHGAGVAISVDTTKAVVAAAAVEAGADIINDISCLADPEMASVAADSGTHLILMHRRGTPETMQQDTHYDDLLEEIHSFLATGIQRASSAGVEGRIAVDPGLGFGKSASDNLALIRHLRHFTSLGCPLVVGASRKSFIWKSAGLSPEGALAGSLAAAVLAAINGADAIRVHDVAETVQAVRLAEAVQTANPSST